MEPVKALVDFTGKGKSVLTCWLLLGRLSPMVGGEWYLSSKDRNRLQHALNGNTVQLSGAPIVVDASPSGPRESADSHPPPPPAPESQRPRQRRRVSRQAVEADNRGASQPAGAGKPAFELLEGCPKSPDRLRRASNDWLVPSGKPDEKAN